MKYVFDGEIERATHDGEASLSIVIADDHEFVRQALRNAFQTPGLVEVDGLDVVAEACNGKEVLSAVKQHRPNAVTLTSPCLKWAATKSFTR